MCDDQFYTKEELQELLDNAIIPFPIYGVSKANEIIIGTSRGSLSTKPNKKGEWIIDLADLEEGYKGLRKIVVNGKKIKLKKGDMQKVEVNGRSP